MVKLVWCRGCWCCTAWSSRAALQGEGRRDGGMMSLEALAAGVPVVTYRCIAGHGETNASVLDRAGLVPWIRSYAHLGDGIAKAIAPTRRPDLWSATLAIRPSIVQAVFSPPCVWTRVGFERGRRSRRGER